MADARGFCPSVGPSHCIVGDMSMASFFTGDFCIWTVIFTKLHPNMGNRIRKLSVHALCLAAMFGYDV
jgi:hypothetical protein